MRDETNITRIRGKLFSPFFMPFYDITVPIPIASVLLCPTMKTNVIILTSAIYGQFFEI